MKGEHFLPSKQRSTQSKAIALLLCNLVATNGSIIVLHGVVLSCTLKYGAARSGNCFAFGDGHVYAVMCKRSILKHAISDIIRLCIIHKFTLIFVLKNTKFNCFNFLFL